MVGPPSRSQNGYLPKSCLKLRGYYSVLHNSKKVAIKPNVLRISRADEHIVTHPSVLRTVINKVETLAPSEIINQLLTAFLCLSGNRAKMINPSTLSSSRPHSTGCCCSRLTSSTVTRGTATPVIITAIINTPSSLKSPRSTIKMRLK